MATRKKTARARSKSTGKGGRATAKKKPAARRSPGPTKTATKAKGLSLTSVSPAFTVDDIDKSVAWYGGVMGFTVGDKWVENGKLVGVTLIAGRSMFMVSQDDWKKGRDRVKGEGFRLYCQTDQDVDKFAAGIKSRGGSLLTEPQDAEWGTRAFAVQDPDGFKITIASEPGAR